MAPPWSCFGKLFFLNHVFNLFLVENGTTLQSGTKTVPQWGHPVNMKTAPPWSHFGSTFFFQCYSDWEIGGGFYWRVASITENTVHSTWLIGSKGEATNFCLQNYRTPIGRIGIFFMRFSWTKFWTMSQSRSFIYLDYRFIIMEDWHDSILRERHLHY